VGDGAKKGNGGGQRHLWWPGGAGGEEKGMGVWGLVPQRGKTGKREGGPGAAGELRRGQRPQRVSGGAESRSGSAVARDRGGTLRGGTVARGPRVESVDRPREKGKGPTQGERRTGHAQRNSAVSQLTDFFK
jgi:hypothetical protein